MGLYSFIIIFNLIRCFTHFHISFLFLSFLPPVNRKRDEERKKTEKMFFVCRLYRKIVLVLLFPCEFPFSFFLWVMSASIRLFTVKQATQSFHWHDDHYCRKEIDRKRRDCFSFSNQVFLMKREEKQSITWLWRQKQWEIEQR